MRIVPYQTDVTVAEVFLSIFRLAFRIDEQRCLRNDLLLAQRGLSAKVSSATLEIGDKNDVDIIQRLSAYLGLICLWAVAVAACAPLESARTIAPTAISVVASAPTPTSPAEISTSASSSYEFLRQWGSDVTSDGRLTFPDGIAVDAAGNVYVGDKGNSRIQKFSSEGGFLTK
jgi:NHL repeat